ncbi:MAG TPA: response regulator transcription factor [Candidatus Omnitrophota bacterium]|nr:response regulator transcription factor [Candidatus Omnitrophota bacterium]HPT07068.1 response regulator transcription factor [Candidatus Omnitrophota bacterium]
MEKSRILVIDDDRNAAASLKEFLDSEGFDVVLAESGEEGIIKIPQEKPRIILLDLVLPGQSGFKTAQEIKQNPEYAAIPIIAISLRKEDIDKHAAAISGIEDYLEKPVDFHKLLFCIKNILK